MSYLSDEIEDHFALAHAMRAALPQVDAIADLICATLAEGGKVLAFGNGGSAAEAQHFTGELIGRFRAERRSLPALALTADSATLTCIGNDYAFADIFSRQVSALARPGDAVVGLSTSGTSGNVLNGLEAARKVGAHPVFFSAASAPANGPEALTFRAPGSGTARIQEMHLLAIHMICLKIDNAFTETDA